MFKRPFSILDRVILLTVGFVAIWLIARFLLRSKIEVVRPVRGPAVQAVYATGTIEASIMLPIATRGSARMIELLADEGDEVAKNQLLAKLENEDLRSALEALRAKESFAKKDYERMSAMRKQDSVSQQSLDKAKTDWDAAKSSAAQAEAQTRFMDLVAPEKGRIIRRDGEIGQLISAAQNVFWLAVTSPLRISAEVDEEDIALVKVDQAVLIRADAFPGQVFKGKVKSITPKGDPIARSYRVRIELSEETPLRIGMTAETNIIVKEQPDAILLPASAVDRDEVWLVKGATLSKQTVSVGVRGNKEIEITSGIELDDIVVLQPSSDLKEGKRVSTQLVEPRT